MALFAFAQGLTGTVGEVDAVTIDAYVAANPTSNVVTIQFNEFSALFTAAGFDIAELDNTTEYPFAWNALRWASAHEILAVNFAAVATVTDLQKGGQKRSEYERKLKMYVENVAGNLIKLNITTSKWILIESRFGVTIKANIVDNCHDAPTDRHHGHNIIH